VSALEAPTFDAKRLADEVRTLSSDAFEGRGPATAGEEKTVAWLTEQFKAAGLQPGGDLVDGKRGWTQVTEATGRILVGLPFGGSAGAAFGGPPLRSKEDRAHAHRLRGFVTTNAQAMAAASPGGADGYGLHGTYPLSSTPTESTTLRAYVPLLLCRKN
jgi:hypothetical protein